MSEGLTEHDLWIMEHPAQLIGGPNDGQLAAIRGVALEVPYVDLSTRLVTVHRYRWEHRGGESYVGVYEGVVQEYLV